MSADKPLALAGLRVLDLGQFIATPFCTMWLAWLGAEVIVVESRKRMTSRTAPPFAEGHGDHVDASGYFNTIGSSKKSCTVDMTTARGRDLVRQLAAKCDVVVDNFSTGVMEKLGLGYDALSALSPGIVMVSNGAFGRSGPMCKARGLHSAVNLFSGVADLTGYVDGHARILGGVIPDPLSGTYGGFALLAALHHRNKTGRGQFIDLAMYEGMMTLIPEAVIDLTLNGREPERTGNRDKTKAPHGIYRCRGDDHWLALSVGSDSEFAAFCRATGRGDWAADLRFATVEGRLSHVAVLDLQVENWAEHQDLHEAVDTLQAIGIAAGPVLRIDELFNDEHLNTQGLVVETDHPRVGRRRQFGLPWRMDNLGIDYRAAPLLGESTHDVLTKLLGIDEASYAELDAAGVLA